MRGVISIQGTILMKAFQMISVGMLEENSVNLKLFSVYLPTLCFMIAIFGQHGT